MVIFVQTERTCEMGEHFDIGSQRHVSREIVQIRQTVGIIGSRINRSLL